jgi:hypothetical protein
MSDEPNEHCYSIAARTTHVLESIAFENTTPSADVTGGPYGEFTTAEEWISFENQGSKYANSWIENGQIVGRGYSCCTPHAFYAEEQHWRGREQGWHIDINEGASPLNTYNHYFLFDPEANGRWHVYWGCCEVATYGGGWPVWLTEQSAGAEVAAEVRPEVWGRQEVAASNGGEWWAWTGAELDRWPGMCLSYNVESSAPGNIMWATGCP